jgi:hypothetical protein
MRYVLVKPQVETDSPNDDKTITTLELKALIS